MVGLAGWLVWLHRRFLAVEDREGKPLGGLTMKRAFVYLALTLVIGGAAVWLTA